MKLFSRKRAAEFLQDKEEHIEKIEHIEKRIRTRLPTSMMNLDPTSLRGRYRRYRGMTSSLKQCITTGMDSGEQGESSSQNVRTEEDLDAMDIDETADMNNAIEHWNATTSNSQDVTSYILDTMSKILDDLEGIDIGEPSMAMKSDAETVPAPTENPTPLLPDFQIFDPESINELVRIYLHDDVPAATLSHPDYQNISHPFFLGWRTHYKSEKYMTEPFNFYTRRLLYCQQQLRKESSEERLAVIDQYQKALFLGMNRLEYDIIIPYKHEYDGEDLDEDVFAIINAFERSKPISEIKEEILDFYRTLMVRRYGAENCPAAWSREGAYNGGLWHELIYTIRNDKADEFLEGDDAENTLVSTLKRESKELGLAVPVDFIWYLHMFQGEKYDQPPADLSRRAICRSQYGHLAFMFAADAQNVAKLRRIGDTDQEIAAIYRTIKDRIETYFPTANTNQEPQNWNWPSWVLSKTQAHTALKRHRAQPSDPETKKDFQLRTPIQEGPYPLEGKRRPCSTKGEIMNNAHYNPLGSGNTITPRRGETVPPYIVPRMWQHRQPPKMETVMVARKYVLNVLETEEGGKKKGKGEA